MANFSIDIDDESAHSLGSILFTDAADGEVCCSGGCGGSVLAPLLHEEAKMKGKNPIYREKM